MIYDMLNDLTEECVKRTLDDDSIELPKRVIKQMLLSLLFFIKSRQSLHASCFKLEKSSSGQIPNEAFASSRRALFVC